MNGHEIYGEESYLNPWRTATQFTSHTIKGLKNRFPDDEFLKALDILNPQAWKDYIQYDYEDNGINSISIPKF